MPHARAIRDVKVPDSERSQGLPAGAVDPVCGMRVDPASAAGHHAHDGDTYHYCSEGCLRRFRADPHATPPVREEQTLRNDPNFAAGERTFATLPGFIE